MKTWTITECNNGYLVQVRSGNHEDNVISEAMAAAIKETGDHGYYIFSTMKEVIKFLQQ